MLLEYFWEVGGNKRTNMSMGRTNKLVVVIIILILIGIHGEVANDSRIRMGLTALSA